MSRFVTNLEALEATEPYDLCIIGASMAGSVVALRCAHAGLRVLLIESDASLRQRHVPKRHHEIETRGSAGYTPKTHVPWNGICERFEPCEFRGQPYTPRCNPWPIGYGELAQYYSLAERTFRVRGGVRGRTPDRTLPGLPLQRVDVEFEDWIGRFGIAARTIAQATASGDASLFDVRRELLPQLIATRHAAFVSGVTATRLRSDRNGRIIGVTCRTTGGVKRIARANMFVVACGGIQTPRLMLLSRSQRFPQGIGNEHDRVGRGFNDQALVTVRGDVKHGPLLRRPRSVQTQNCYRAFRRYRLGAIQPMFSLMPRIAQLGRGGGARRLLETLSGPLDPQLTISCRVEIRPTDCNRVTLSTSTADGFGDAIARIDFDLSHEDRRLLDRTRPLLHRWLDRFAAQRHVEQTPTWAGEAIGTCRMGVDPQRSVCDPTLRVHSSPNLFLCGSETFPTGSPLPPALTTAALAHRLADYLIARVRWCNRAPPSSKPRPAPTAPAPAVALVRRRPT